MPEIRTTRYYENQTPQTGTAESLSNAQETANDSSMNLPTPEPVTPEPASPRNELLFAADTDNFFPPTSTGRIVVEVQTARGSFPVPEAAVIIYRRENGENQVVSFQLTDRSGKTPEITVPAPPKSDAQSPSPDLPFADYNISVRHPMYYTAITDNVQVFGDELTIQNVELIPLPEFVNETDITKTITIPRQNL